MEKYYSVLGLTPNASLKDIKQAYRDLVRIWHPDRFQQDERLKLKTQETLKEINEAYDILIKYYESRSSRSAYQSSETTYSSKTERQDQTTSQQGFSRNHESSSRQHEQKDSWFKTWKEFYYGEFTPSDPPPRKSYPPLTTRDKIIISIVIGPIIIMIGFSLLLLIVK